MAMIPIIPSILGLSSGLVVYPLLMFLFAILRRVSEQRNEESRLKDTTFILSSNVEEKRLLKDLTTLHDGNRQGVLHFFSGRRKGYILFRNGKVIDIFYRNESGIAAFTLLSKLTEGEYFFESRAVYQPTLFDGNTEELLSIIE